MARLGGSSLMFAEEIGVDLGTANAVIYVKGKGILLEEPSAVAVDRRKDAVIAVGEPAQRMLGRSPEHIEVIHPLREGVIADFDTTEKMLRYFLEKIKVQRLLSKPGVLICHPADITEIEKKALLEAAEKAGGKKIELAEEPKVAALCAGIDIFQPDGNMIVDIGGGTTGVAVLSMGEIVSARLIRGAGDKFSTDLTTYINKRYALQTGEHTIEKVKKNIAINADAGESDNIQVEGLDNITGLPRVITVTSGELTEALEESLGMITRTIKAVLEDTPPELTTDVKERGIVLTGGGALMKGLGIRFREELNMPVFVSEDPLHSAAKGAGMMLEGNFRRNRRT